MSEQTEIEAAIRLRGALERIKAVTGTSTEAWHIAEEALSSSSGPAGEPITPEEASKIRVVLLSAGLQGPEWDVIWVKLRRLAALHPDQKGI